MAKDDDFNVKKTEKITRRNFFKIFSGLFSGLIALTLGIPMIDSLTGTIIKKKNNTYSKLTPVSAISDNQPVNLPFVMTDVDNFIKDIQPENVWTVKKSDYDITVFSPICPHLGCRYQWNGSRRLFMCPCHHSVFNINGEVVSGPAPRPLDTLPIKIKNDYLYVIWERFKPGIAKKETI